MDEYSPYNLWLWHSMGDPTCGEYLYGLLPDQQPKTGTHYDDSFNPGGVAAPHQHSFQDATPGMPLMDQDNTHISLPCDSFAADGPPPPPPQQQLLLQEAAAPGPAGSFQGTATTGTLDNIPVLQQQQQHLANIDGMPFIDQHHTNISLPYDSYVADVPPPPPQHLLQEAAAGPVGFFQGTATNGVSDDVPVLQQHQQRYANNDGFGDTTPQQHPTLLPSSTVHPQQHQQRDHDFIMDSDWDNDFFESLNQAQDPQWTDVETSSQDSPGEIGESLRAGDPPQEHSNTEIEQTNEELRRIKRKQQNKEAQRRSRIKKKLERENHEKQLHEVGLALQECYGISIAELLEKYRSIMC